MSIFFVVDCKQHFVIKVILISYWAEHWYRKWAWRSSKAMHIPFHRVPQDRSCHILGGYILIIACNFFLAILEYVKSWSRILIALNIWMKISNGKWQFQFYSNKASVKYRKFLSCVEQTLNSCFTPVEYANGENRIEATLVIFPSKYSPSSVIFPLSSSVKANIFISFIKKSTMTYP